jgi:signal transduction histidine kinase
MFILACGATHAMDVWTLWHATYWLSGAVKVLTAAASMSTAILLVRLVPEALALPSPETLRREVAERTLAEEARSRSLSHRLHNSKLDYQGLAAATAGFCREFSDRHGVAIVVRSEDISNDLPPEISLCLYRVAQEALQNAMKHSGSQRVEVSLKGTLNEILLTVRDFGIGFDPNDGVKGRGLGLISMKERLNLVGGELSIDSQPQTGTTILSRVALKAGWNGSLPGQADQGTRDRPSVERGFVM